MDAALGGAFAALPQKQAKPPVVRCAATTRIMGSLPMPVTSRSSAWVWRHLGNIQSLINTSLASFKNAVRNPIEFDPNTGYFRDSEGRILDDDSIQLLIKSGRSIASRAGVSTYKRSAVLNALVREEGGKSSTEGTGAGVLAKLVAVGRKFPAPSKGIFYAKGSSGLTPAVPTCQRQQGHCTSVGSLTPQPMATVSLPVPALQDSQHLADLFTTITVVFQNQPLTALQLVFMGRWHHCTKHAGSVAYGLIWCFGAINIGLF